MRLEKRFHPSLRCHRFADKGACSAAAGSGLKLAGNVPAEYDHGRSRLSARAASCSAPLAEAVVRQFTFACRRVICANSWTPGSSSTTNTSIMSSSRAGDSTRKHSLPIRGPRRPASDPHPFAGRSHARHTSPSPARSADARVRAVVRPSAQTPPRDIRPR